MLEIDEKAAGISRDEVLAVLQAENIRARRYFYPACHRMEPYRSADPDAGRHLPVTEAVADRLLVLPTGAGITMPDIAAIASVISVAVGAGPGLVASLHARH